MARTKRKVNPVLPVTVSEEQPRRVYQTGGYIRLSVEDSGKPGTDTIDTQRELVQGYINSQPDMRVYDLYCDGCDIIGLRQQSLDTQWFASI